MSVYGQINVYKFGAGFFSNYHIVLTTIMWCIEEFKIKPYVNLNHTAWVENYNPYLDYSPLNPVNTWNWWFDQEIPTERDKVIPLLPLSNPNTFFSHTEQFWKRKDIPYARSIVDKYIHIKSHILKQVDEYYEKYFKNHVVLGIMARGGEIFHHHPQYGNQTIETWIEYTRNIKKEHPEIDTIFLVTEDSNYIPIYLNEFPDTLYLKDVFRRTKEKLEYMIEFTLWPCIAKPRENHCQLLGDECLTQALLLSKCDYLLVKHCNTTNIAILCANENLKDVIYAL